jgi:hypothetical protein
MLLFTDYVMLPGRTISSAQQSTAQIITNRARAAVNSTSNQSVCGLQDIEVMHSDAIVGSSLSLWFNKIIAFEEMERGIDAVESFAIDVMRLSLESAEETHERTVHGLCQHFKGVDLVIAL